jgi:hypothetical protein
MTNDYLERRHTCIYRSIQKGCLDCRSPRPCPPLIVIAMRYAREIARPHYPVNDDRTAPSVTSITESNTRPAL